MRQPKRLLPQLSRRAKKPSVPTLRTYAGELKYLQAKLSGNLSPLHLEDRLREWKYWAIIDNKFPYNAIFRTHHLLLPKRVTSEDQLTAAEKKELETILKELDVEGEYDCQLINFTKKQSIISHYHIHLLAFRQDGFSFKK